MSVYDLLFSKLQTELVKVHSLSCKSLSLFVNYRLLLGVGYLHEAYCCHVPTQSQPQKVTLHVVIMSLKVYIYPGEVIASSIYFHYCAVMIITCSNKVLGPLLIGVIWITCHHCDIRVLSVFSSILQWRRNELKLPEP